MVDPDNLAVNLIGQIKNNYGPRDLPAREYHIDGVEVAKTDEGTIDAGKFIWGQLRDESIREIIEAAKDSGELRTATKEAQGWLTDYLKSVGGRALSQEIKQAGQKVGHSARTLDRARKAARIRVESEGFPRVTYWSTEPEFRFAQAPTSHGETGTTEPD